MKRLYKTTLQAPKDAAFINVVSKHGNALSVDYFRENKERISHVNISARVISEDTYRAMTEAPESMKKLNDFTKGNATADPRSATLKKTADLPKGRKLTKGEEVLGAGEEPHKKAEKRRDEDKPDLKAPKRAKEPKGKGAGAENAFESLGYDPLLDGLKEDDDAAYKWSKILKAMTEAGLMDDDIRAVQGYLRGHEFSFNEARLEESDQPEDQYNPDDLEAANDVADEESDQQNEIYPGQPVEEAEEHLESVSRRHVDRVQNLQKGVQIKIVKMNDEKVTKVIPSKVIRVDYKRPNFYAVCSVDPDQKVELKIARDPDVVYLKQGSEDGVYYYVERLGPIERDEPTVKYHGDNINGKEDQSPGMGTERSN